MHSSKSFGLAPLVLPLPFRNRINPSIWYLFEVQYAVTRGSRSRSAFPNLAASRRAVGSLIRVYCEYTSRPLSKSGPSSPKSGLGNSFSFCAFFVVLCGPILEAGTVGIDTPGAPWLLRRRSLLFKADSAVGLSALLESGERVDRGSCDDLMLGPVSPSIVLTTVCGLKVTFLIGFVLGSGVLGEAARMRGVFSFAKVDAMAS